jgi:TorA maturation chaperone TorD
VKKGHYQFKQLDERKLCSFFAKPQKQRCPPYFSSNTKVWLKRRSSIFGSALKFKGLYKTTQLKNNNSGQKNEITL